MNKLRSVEPVQEDESEDIKLLRQTALLHFMCALVKDTTLPHGSEDEANWCAKTASLLTDAYIKELNSGS